MDTMDIYTEIELQDCPFCRGAGLLEEESGWCWYVTCVDCGAQTAPISFRTEDKRVQAAKDAARLWNMGKVIPMGNGD